MLHIIYVGTSRDGEFCTLRTKGETRALHIWQLIHILIINSLSDQAFPPIMNLHLALVNLLDINNYLKTSISLYVNNKSMPVSFHLCINDYFKEFNLLYINN